jgi:hypothetical protein
MCTLGTCVHSLPVAYMASLIVQGNDGKPLLGSVRMGCVNAFMILELRVGAARSMLEDDWR